MQRFRFLVAAAMMVAGCGELQITPSSSPPTGSDTDAGVFEDTRLPESDGGLISPPVVGDMGDTGVGSDDGAPPDEPDADTMIDAARCSGAADCGDGASCEGGECVCDDGLLGDPYRGCSAENPCQDVDCPAGASCSPDGMCDCDPFFDDDGSGGCIPREPAADIASRDRGEVCDIWTNTFSRSSNDMFLIEPIDACDPGVMHPDEMRSALHRTSQFRMLVGLYPVSLDAGRLASVQECATMHAATNMGLSHNPPDTWECYTQAGAAGAGSSNLASGIATPAGTVGLYVADQGVPSLGHRRWVFNPSMAGTAFGHRGSYGCMYAFGGGRSHNPDFVAYPSPGPFPKAAVSGKWSISGGGSWTDDHTVTVTNMTDASEVSVSNITSPAFGSLASTLSWSVSTNQLPVDTDYAITIRDSGGTLVREYTTTLVDCP